MVILDKYLSLLGPSHINQTPPAPFDPVPQEVMDEVKETVMKVWIWPERTASKYCIRQWQALNKWSLLGLLCGTERRQGVPNMPLREYLPGYEAYIGSCHWRDCLCSHKKPSHRMHRCSGCQIAYYCSRRCQTRRVPFGIVGQPNRPLF